MRMTYDNMKGFCLEQLGAELVKATLKSTTKKGKSEDLPIHWFDVTAANGKQAVLLISQTLVKKAKGRKTTSPITMEDIAKVLRQEQAVIEDWHYEDDDEGPQNGWWYRMPGGTVLGTIDVANIDF